MKGFPFLCNSILYGKTKDNVNNETMSYDPVYINAINVNETTITYTITGLHPSLSYTFSVYIMDLFNNTKDQDYITFGKLIVMYTDSLSL